MYCICCWNGSQHAVKPDIGSESRFPPTPLAFDVLVGGGYSVGILPCRLVWKTRMVWLPDGEKNLKICLFVLTECTNVTDRHTPHDSIGRACIAYDSAAETRPSRAITHPSLIIYVHAKGHSRSCEWHCRLEGTLCRVYRRPYQIYTTIFGPYLHRLHRCQFSERNWKLTYFSNLIWTLFCSLLWFSVAIVVLEVICYLGHVKKM